MISGADRLEPAENKGVFLALAELNLVKLHPRRGSLSPAMKENIELGAAYVSEEKERGLRSEIRFIGSSLSSNGGFCLMRVIEAGSKDHRIITALLRFYILNMGRGAICATRERESCSVPASRRGSVFELVLARGFNN